MHRLFVGIDPPPGVKDALVDIMGGIIGARWQREDQLHLTLRFIGEVERRAANDIAEALATVRHPAFTVEASGIGLFDRRGRPEALWVGVDPLAPLKTLHNKVDRALERVGIPPDTRAYRPHITLARFGKGAGALDAFMRTHGGLRVEPFCVDAFCLYESHLTNEGSHYEIVERHELTGEPSSDSLARSIGK
jgi:2'-5' RNA ligase